MNIDFDVMREPNFFQRIEKARVDDLKKVDKVGWNDVTFCPVCGSTERDGIRFETDIPFYICSNCDCLYDSKIPKTPNKAHYDIKDINEIVNLVDEGKREYRKQRFAKERIGLIKQYWDKPLSGSTLLDVGCNTGFFLEEAKKHFRKVTGVEPVETLAEYAEKKLEIDVHPTVDITLNYDVVTLFDVIEHVDKPFDFLYNLKQHLNPNGIIVVFTPNWRSLGFDFLGTRNNQYLPADHLQFFSKQTVIELESKLEMTSEMFQTCGMDWFDILAYERDINKINITESLLLKNVNKLQKLTDDDGYGNHLRFIMRR